MEMLSDSEGKSVRLFGVMIPVERNREETLVRNSLSRGDIIGPNNAHGVQGARRIFGGHVNLSGGGINQSARNTERQEGVRQRKKAQRWTIQEHVQFLHGLRAAGKGNWKGISKNFVRTRTSAQVASHAQKYYLRQSKPVDVKLKPSVFNMELEDIYHDAEIYGYGRAPPPVFFNRTHPAHVQQQTNLPSVEHRSVQYPMGAMMSQAVTPNSYPPFVYAPTFQYNSSINIYAAAPSTSLQHLRPAAPANRNNNRL